MSGAEACTTWAGCAGAGAVVLSLHATSVSAITTAAAERMCIGRILWWGVGRDRDRSRPRWRRRGTPCLGTVREAIDIPQAFAVRGALQRLHLALCGPEPVAMKQ